MTKTLGPKGEALIKNGEELVLYTYDDHYYPPRPFMKGTPVGNLTIGYGHTSKAGLPSVTPNMRITADRADKIFESDIAKFVDRVNSSVRVELTQEQFDALVSFDYNTGALTSSTLLKKLNAGNYDAVTSELMKWVHDDGKVLPGLIKRRTAECQLWACADDVKIAPSRTNPKPAPAKPMVESKIGKASVGVAFAGGISAVNQISDTVTKFTSTAQSSQDAFAGVRALLGNPGVALTVLSVVLACAIWYWRKQMATEQAS